MAGHIAVCRAKIRDQQWEGWMIEIIKPDGESDEAREPWLYDREGDADLQAGELAKLSGLEIKKDRREFDRPASNVIHLVNMKERR